MPLISADTLRERFDIDSSIRDGRLLPAIGSAAKRLRGWVGDERYNEAAAVDVSAETENPLINDLRNSEANLAMHFAILGLNSPLTSKGVVGTNMASEGREVRKYLSPKETQELATQFLELAREIADPYIAQGDDVGIAVVDFIGGSPTNCEAATRPCP